MNENMKQEAGSWLLALVVALLVGVVFRFHCVELFSVDGVSMVPTLADKDKLLVEKISYRLDKLKHGDILVFHYPHQPEQIFVKRIIAMEGDSIEIKNGHVYVNDTELQEFTYTTERPEKGFAKEIVPKDSFFVLGDNRNNSEDSRFPEVGFVPKEQVIGRALCVVFPVQNSKKLNLTIYAK